MDVVCIRLQVLQRDIALLCSLIAGYEGVAIVRTVDSTQGLVELLVAPAFYVTALTLLTAFSQDIDLCLIETRESLSIVHPGDDATR